MASPWAFPEWSSPSQLRVRGPLLLVGYLRRRGTLKDLTKSTCTKSCGRPLQPFCFLRQPRRMLRPCCTKTAEEDADLHNSLPEKRLQHPYYPTASLPVPRSPCQDRRDSL